QLRVLATLTARQELDVLDGRGLDALKPVTTVDVEDGGDGTVSDPDLVRKHIAHAAWWRGVEPGFSRHGRWAVAHGPTIAAWPSPTSRRTRASTTPGAAS